MKIRKIWKGIVRDFVTTLLSLSTKYCDDGGGDVQNCPNLRDVIYGRPQRSSEIKSSIPCMAGEAFDGVNIRGSLTLTLGCDVIYGRPLG